MPSAEDVLNFRVDNHNPDCQNLTLLSHQLSLAASTVDPFNVTSICHFHPKEDFEEMRR